MNSFLLTLWRPFMSGSAPSVQQSSAVPVPAFHPFSLQPSTTEELVLCRATKGTSERTQLGFPSPVLALCFWAFATSSPDLCVLAAHSGEEVQTSWQNLPLAVKYKSAACFCCRFWSYRGWENTCMQSCKLFAVYLPILMNKEHVLLMTCLCKRGILCRWTKAVKYDYH